MGCTLQVGENGIYWLNGGGFRLDGGTMFGPVPKKLWAARYPADEDNTIPMVNDPLLVVTPEHRIIIDSGLGNKLSEKQKTIFQIQPEWDLPAELNRLGFTREDIDIVILTHGDFDHAGGIVMADEHGEYELTFPNARHFMHILEWQDVQDPGLRSKSTYFKENFLYLEPGNNLILTEHDVDVCKGVKIYHSGGHTRGHQIVEITSRKQTAVHLGDLMPTHAHVNPLWVMAYDNFPLDVIDSKIKYYDLFREKDAWYTSYHDPVVRACRLNKDTEIVEKWPA